MVTEKDSNGQSCLSGTTDGHDHQHRALQSPIEADFSAVASTGNNFNEPSRIVEGSDICCSRFHLLLVAVGHFSRRPAQNRAVVKR
jgi:hypothetical protein